METKTEEFEEEKEQIKILLKEKNIELKDLSIKRENSGRYIINAYTNVCDNENGKNCPIKPLGRLFRKSFR